ncbi:MAG: dienelactone hydrolase family protein [Herpetosiphonaceae bacterium]|nr:dienelactone hydrolase family protein [Herpetosiphonaceae bacterium]
MTDTLNDMQQYLVDEFVEEYQEGHLSRREALRQIGAIAGMTAAIVILAACGSPQVSTTATTDAVSTTAAIATTVATSTPASSASAGSALVAASADPSVQVAPDDPGLTADMMSFPGTGATLMGYLAQPVRNSLSPIVLVCHENMGLTPYIQNVARRLAKAGYVALAVDLLGRQGGTAKVSNPGDVPGILGKLPPDQLVQDFQSGMRYLQSQPYVIKDRVGMVGFCYGGGVTWRVATKTPELRAAVPFYGPPPAVTDIPMIQAAVLAFYGALDTRITQSEPTIEAAMKQNNKTFEKQIYPGAGHAFHHDGGANYNPGAAKDAWEKTLAWFKTYLRA